MGRGGLALPVVTEGGFLRATRDGYDAIADDYDERFAGELGASPLARAMLAVFAELVQSGGGGAVAEVGSGPGRVTAQLDRLGLDVHGIDLSPRMVALARRTFPRLRFREGSMTALDLPDGALAGLAAWYSIIHIPPDRLAGVIGEFHRVLAPGGHLVVAFQVGDAPLHFDEAFGHRVDLDFRRLNPDHVAGLLERAGFTVQARMVRAPSGWESVPQAYLLAGKPPVG